MEKQISKPQVKKRLRVLCFHGFGTNTEIMKLQMRFFEKYFNKDIEFSYMNGTYVVDLNRMMDDWIVNFVTDSGQEKKIYSWFIWRNVDKRERTNTKIMEQVEAATKDILDSILKQGPFDGILGFSQGGIMAHTLAKFFENNKDKYKDIAPKFYVFVGGSYPPITGWLDTVLNVPTVHIFGFEDFLYDRCVLMTTKYRDPVVMVHPEGHKFPKFSDYQIMILRKFFARFSTRPAKTNFSPTF